MTLRIYTLILYLALPFIFLRLLWRSRKNPDYRNGWSERLGLCQLQGVEGAIWILAVSVGESQAAEPLVRLLQTEYPSRPILMTTTTPTGAAHVRKLYDDSVVHCYFPLDYPFAVRGFLGQVRPALLLMMETEIWPNLLVECERREIPTLLANARLSEKSAKSYARFETFTREVFSSIGQIAAQADADANRFIGLGADVNRVAVTGSLKFDLRIPASLFEQAESLRRMLGTERPVWIAASTREGEEEYILEAFAEVKKQLPNALLMLVPRHPERFDMVAALCQREGFSLIRRSNGGECSAETEVFLGDTMGELSLFLAAADVAFVGGSLVKCGGHNVLEASALGLPVAFGPHMFNFSTISRLLLSEGAAVQVEDAAMLGRTIGHWLQDADERNRVGEAGRLAVERNRGARERLFALVEKMVD